MGGVYHAKRKENDNKIPGNPTCNGDCLCFFRNNRRRSFGCKQTGKGENHINQERQL